MTGAQDKLEAHAPGGWMCLRAALSVYHSPISFYLHPHDWALVEPTTNAGIVSSESEPRTSHRNLTAKNDHAV